jgi:hypothetical protein
MVEGIVGGAFDCDGCLVAAGTEPGRRLAIVSLSRGHGISPPCIDESHTVVGPPVLRPHAMPGKPPGL